MQIADSRGGKWDTKGLGLPMVPGNVGEVQRLYDKSTKTEKLESWKHALVTGTWKGSSQIDSANLVKNVRSLNIYCVCVFLRVSKDWVHITFPTTPAHLKDTNRYIFSTQRARLQNCAQGNMQRGFVEARTNLAETMFKVAWKLQSWVMMLDKNIRNMFLNFGGGHMSSHVERKEFTKMCSSKLRTLNSFAAGFDSFNSSDTLNWECGFTGCSPNGLSHSNLQHPVVRADHRVQHAAALPVVTRHAIFLSKTSATVRDMKWYKFIHTCEFKILGWFFPTSRRTWKKIVWVGLS